MNSDLQYLTVNSLRAKVRIGVDPAERAYPQVVEFSIRMAVDISEATRSDRLADTVDYQQLCIKLQEFLSSNSWHVLEKLVFDVANQCLEFSNMIQEIQIKGTKRIIPDIEGFSVELIVKR